MFKTKEHYQFCHEIEKDTPLKEEDETSDTFIAWLLTALWIMVIIVLPFLLYVSNGAKYEFSDLKLME